MSRGGPQRPATGALAPLLLLLAACGGTGATSAAQPSGAPCTSLPPADPAVTLPAGLPSPEGQVLYEKASQGSTDVVFGRVEGTDVVAVRDQVAAALEDAGYELSGTDQEAVEAEVHFVQPLDGTVKVSTLCEGVLQVRYRLSPP